MPYTIRSNTFTLLFLLACHTRLHAQLVASATLPDAPSATRSSSHGSSDRETSETSSSQPEIYPGSSERRDFGNPADLDSTTQGSSAAESNSQNKQIADPQPKPGSQTKEQAESAGSPERADAQGKRIFGIIPNFRSVSADQKLPPQSVKEKFKTTTQDSFDYSAIALPAVVAGYSQLRSATPEFGTGGVAYGRYLWHSVLDQTAENYWVEFIIPAITHEDTRFYILGRGSNKKRVGNAVKHVFITRSDSGKDVFNAGEIVGAAISSAETNAYYPAPERSVGNTLSQFGTNIGIDLVSYIFKEYYPELNRKVFHASPDSGDPK